MNNSSTGIAELKTEAQDTEVENIGNYNYL